jgi:anti-sigma factor ChrR (cupin superfamily)
MQTVRFFEDRGNPGGARRLLVGVASCEESWQVDGGRREAVAVATTEDAERYPVAYAAYYQSFAQHEEAAAPAPASA